MRFLRLVAFATLSALPSLLTGQVMDSLRVGDRVRVRVASTRGNTNLFVGNVASLSSDTLVVDIPGGKGTIILPRAAIAEVAIGNGRESRFANLPRMAPLLVLPVMLATGPSYHSGPHANALRNQRYILAALTALPVISVFTRTPPERWEPVYSWLDGRRAP
jgi:hypothetical protein